MSGEMEKIQILNDNGKKTEKSSVKIIQNNIWKNTLQRQNVHS